MQTWWKRWFELRVSDIPDSMYLEYYISANEKSSKCIFLLDNNIELGYVVEDPEPHEYANIVCIKTKLAYLYIKTETIEEMTEWMEHICHACQKKINDWRKYIIANKSLQNRMAIIN